MRRIALLFAAVALLYAGPGLIPGRTFAPIDLPLDAGAWNPHPTERVRVSNTLLGDVIVQFVPWDTEIVRMLARGEAPWVNRWAGDGGPLFANPQTALFSPFTWPRLLFGLDGWAIMAILKLLAAALCMYWLARELDVPPAQAALSGLVYATGGYTIVWLLYPITQVFTLLAGLAAASLRLMKTPTLRNAALVILFAALATAGGHPETLFIGVTGIFLFLAWEAEKRRDLGLSAIIPPAAGALLGFLLLAVQTVPFLVILGNSYAEVLRPSMPHPFRMWGVVSQVLPGVLGTPLRGELDLTAIPMAENFNLRAGGYVGAIVLLAIVVSFRRLPSSLRRGLAIGGVALLLSWYPPGLWPVVRHVPVLRVLTLEYAAMLFIFFGALAAGPAIAILAAQRRRKIGAALVLTGALALAAGLLPLIPAARGLLQRGAESGIGMLRERGHLRQAPEVYARRLEYYLPAAGMTALRRVAIPGACWLLAGIALLAHARRQLLVSVAAAAELFAFGVGYNPAVAMTEIPPEPEVLRAVKALDPHRQFLIAEHFEILPANLATLYEVRDAVSYDALNVRPRVEQLRPAGFDPLMHAFHPMLSPDEVRALAPLGIRFVLSRVDVAGARRVAGPPPPAVGVYEVPDAIPHALPANRRPAGFVAGLVITILAAAASAVWLRLFLLQPADTPGPG
jgi:hypothetical protein